MHTTGLVALLQVVSSWTRNQTGVPCIGRGVLIHGTTRKSVSLYSVLGKDWAIEEQSWRFQDIESFGDFFPFMSPQSIG